MGRVIIKKAALQNARLDENSVKTILNCLLHDVAIEEEEQQLNFIFHDRMISKSVILEILAQTYRMDMNEVSSIFEFIKLNLIHHDFAIAHRSIGIGSEQPIKQFYKIIFPAYNNGLTPEISMPHDNSIDYTPVIGNSDDGGGMTP